MATKKSKKDSWMDDGDDAHFSDNPAVPKGAKKKSGGKRKSQEVMVLKEHLSGEPVKKKTGKRPARKYAVRK